MTTSVSASTDRAADCPPLSIRKRLEVYDRVVLNHPALEQALSSVQSHVALGAKPSIVLLFGPTGVGKTTLVQALQRSAEPLDGEPSRGRVVYATCVPVAGRSGYDFGRTHWRRLAEAADDVFRDDHVSFDAHAERLRSAGLRPDARPTLAEYRDGVLDMLRATDVRVVILDEVQHMTRVPSARTQADQLDVIKYCVDHTGIPHVLVGTYELAVMVAPGDQLARRSCEVHFRSYDWSLPVDRDAFQRIFGQLVGALPLPDPRKTWEELGKHQRDAYVGCAGCVGILKDWLRRGLLAALRGDQDVLDWSLFKTNGLSNRALLVIAEEIRANRESGASARSKIENALGIGPGVDLGGAEPRSGVRPKPGKRAPARDPIGLPDSARSA